MHSNLPEIIYNPRADAEITDYTEVTRVRLGDPSLRPPRVFKGVYKKKRTGEEYQCYFRALCHESMASHALIFYLNQLKKEEEVLTYLKNISHLPAPRFLDHFMVNNHSLLVMEEVEGKALTKYINPNAPYTSRHKEIIIEVLEHLNQLHQESILHLDLSPEHIIILKKSHNKQKIGFIDYGNVEFLPDSILQRLRKNPYLDDPLILKKKGYSPPEQYIRSLDSLTTAADIFAISATFFYWLTGKKCTQLTNFDSLSDPTSLAEARPVFAKKVEKHLRDKEVDESLVHVLKRGMDLDEHSRITSVEYMLSEINRIDKKQSEHKKNTLSEELKILRDFPSLQQKARILTSQRDLPVALLSTLWCGFVYGFLAEEWLARLAPVLAILWGAFYLGDGFSRLHVWVGTFLAFTMLPIFFYEPWITSWLILASFFAFWSPNKRLQRGLLLVGLSFFMPAIMMPSLLFLLPLMLSLIVRHVDYATIYAFLARLVIFGGTLWAGVTIHPLMNQVIQMQTLNEIVILHTLAEKSTECFFILMEAALWGMIAYTVSTLLVHPSAKIFSNRLDNDLIAWVVGVIGPLIAAIVALSLTGFVLNEPNFGFEMAINQTWTPIIIFEIIGLILVIFYWITNKFLSND